jgi:hypothetical protein
MIFRWRRLDSSRAGWFIIVEAALCFEHPKYDSSLPTVSPKSKSDSTLLFIPTLSGKGKKIMSMKLYVGNLSFDTTSSDLEQIFGEFGTVESASVVEDRDTGRSRGFGFVELSSNEAGQNAIEQLNGKEVSGRQLTVNEAKPRENRTGGGGGRGGYGGGGGRGGGGGGRGGYGGGGGGNRGGGGGGSRW